MAAKSKSTSRKSVSRPKRSGAHPHGRSQRLRESDELFRLAQETLGIVTWIWDIPTDRVQWYGDGARLLGLPKHAFSGRYQDYLKCLHPDDAAAARSVLVDCLKGGRPEYRNVERVVWPDGSIHWLETYGRATYGSEGRAVRLTGVIKEITERKREESARARAEKQLARVFEASPDYMVIVRANDGRFIAANPAFERITGYQSHEIVGRTASELNIWTIPGERERFVADLQEHGSLQNRPVVLRRRNGEIVAGKMSASLIEHEGEKLIISLMHDVSVVKDLERRVRQSESKFAALFEHSPEAISLYRVADGVRLEANAAWERLSGYPRQRAAGRPVQEASLFRSADHRAAIIARIEAEGTVSNVDARLVRADGSEMDALISAVRIELEGTPCILWCWRDVTIEREIARRARQSDARYRALFETSLDGMVIGTPENTVIDANPAACAMTGYTRSELAGRDVALLFCPEDLADQPLRRDLGQRWSVVERRLALKGGGELRVEIVAGPMPDGSVLAMMRDITRLRRND